LAETHEAEKSYVIRERIIKARSIQEKRFNDEEGIYCNAQMSSKMLRKYACPDEAGSAILKSAMQRLNLSARAYDRILKVSRTIADMDGSENVLPEHIAEAVNYRNLDREGWAG
jgi:magnesium chelatase family protein